MLLHHLPAKRGLVGRFLDGAPFLLQDGRSTQAPIAMGHLDWLAECVENELAGLHDGLNL